MIRVLTWNVHGGLGLDGVQDFSRTVDHIVGISPDIAALQEVEGRNRPGKSLPMAILRDRLGHEGISAATITAPDGEYGQVLVGRWPFSEVEIYDLSVGAFEPRRAIAATAHLPDGPLRVVATHLGLRFGERRKQITALCQAIDDERPTVLMGDFNNWIRFRSAHVLLEQRLFTFTPIRTYPAWLPLLALDRIYCRPAAMIAGARAITTARALSDHLPVLAELRYPVGA